MDVALLEFGDDGVEAAGEEAKVEHLAVGEAVEELVQPLQDDRPVDGELVELGGYSVVSRDLLSSLNSQVIGINPNPTATGHNRNRKVR